MANTERSLPITETMTLKDAMMALSWFNKDQDVFGIKARVHLFIVQINRLAGIKPQKARSDIEILRVLKEVLEKDMRDNFGFGVGGVYSFPTEGPTGRPPRFEVVYEARRTISEYLEGIDTGIKISTSEGSSHTAY